MKYEVWWRFWNWLLVNIVKLKFGQSRSWCLFNVLKLKSGQYIEAKVLSRFWSWILVKTLRLRLSGDFGSTFWSGFWDVTKTGCIVMQCIDESTQPLGPWCLWHHGPCLPWTYLWLELFIVGYGEPEKWGSEVAAQYPSHPLPHISDWNTIALKNCKTFFKAFW